MILHQAGMASSSFHALGTTVTVLTTDLHALPLAERALHKDLAANDLACSRFRPDSELSRLNATPGTPTTVSPFLAQAIEAALRAAELTDGAVDPTVGRSLLALGYDRTFVSLRPQDAVPAPAAVPAPGWRTVDWDLAKRRIVLPLRTVLDLGATAKALAADRGARQLAPAGAAPGAGVIKALPLDACGLAATARMLRHLAAGSAGQCGPCHFGLPAVADDYTALADGRSDPGLPDRMYRRIGLLPDRGGCRLPDGAARLAASALRVFATDAEHHLRHGTCGRPDTSDRLERTR